MLLIIWILTENEIKSQYLTVQAKSYNLNNIAKTL